MTIRNIIQLGAKELRLIAQPVRTSDDETQKLIDDLSITLANTQGVGIAAPQIGESKQIIIVASRPTLRYPTAPYLEPTVMINPTFEPLNNNKEKDWEGCLSVPSLRALVPRFTDIRVHYFNEQGKKQDLELTGFVARIFQHEYDHLQGKLFLDKVETNKDIYLESEYLKMRNYAIINFPKNVIS